MQVGKDDFCNQLTFPGGQTFVFGIFHQPQGGGASALDADWSASDYAVMTRMSMTVPERRELFANQLGLRLELVKANAGGMLRLKSHFVER